MSLLPILLPVAALASLPLCLPLARDAALPKGKRRGLAVVIALAVIGGGIGLYHFLGASAWIDAIGTQRDQQAKLRAGIARLEREILNTPQDAQVWRQLGAAWLEAGDAAQAIAPLRRAVLISGGHPDIIAEYAAALVMNNGGTVNEDALASIAMALKLDPEQQLARRLETLWHRQQAAQNEHKPPPQP